MENPKVLIVEDNASIALLMRETLTTLGFNVVGVASTVSDALNQAEITRPKVAIVNVRLGVSRGGLEGASLLRRMLGIMVVFVAAADLAEKQARAEAAGRAALSRTASRVAPDHRCSDNSVELAICWASVGGCSSKMAVSTCPGRPSGRQRGPARLFEYRALTPVLPIRTSILKWYEDQERSDGHRP